MRLVSPSTYIVGNGAHCSQALKVGGEGLTRGPAYSVGYANGMGLIDAKTAFLAYIVLAGLAIVTLEGQSRWVALVVLAVFVVRTYVHILRQRLAAREAEEALVRESSPERKS